MTREGWLGMTRTVSSEGHASAHSLALLQTTLTLLPSRASTRVLSPPSPISPHYSLEPMTPAPMQLQLYLRLRRWQRWVTASTYLPPLWPNRVHLSPLSCAYQHPTTSGSRSMVSSWETSHPCRAPTTPTSTSRAAPLRATPPTSYRAAPLRSCLPHYGQPRVPRIARRRTDRQTRVALLVAAG